MMANVEQTAAMRATTSTRPNRKAEELDLAGRAPTGAGGDSPLPSGCLPGFKLSQFASPRLYFVSLTPKTRATIGNEDYSEGLRQMRTTFPNQPDADMVPFLRVNKGNVKDARKMYSACLEWRRGTLPISRESCLKTLQSGMCYFKGTDKQGRPLGYLTMRGHDPKARDLDECLRAIVFVCEEMIAQQHGREFQVTIILDRNGATSKNQDPDMMKSFFALFSERYPDKLNRVLVVPANLTFRTLWGVIKYSMPERVRNKVMMCSDEKQLLEYVDPSQLHKTLGGEMEFQPASAY